jgi:hypothetical protein
MANERRRQQRRRSQRERLEQQRSTQPPPNYHRRSGIVAAIIVAVVLGAAIISFAVVRGQTKTASSTPTAAARSNTQTAQPIAKTVDGVECAAMEQVAYHIHQHLALYENGKPVPVPADIGIPGGEQSARCFYWIHVHSFTPGIIHVESPVSKVFELGAFFDIWAATQSSALPPGDSYVSRLNAASAHGQVTALYNGKKWNGSYRSIPLTGHAVIAVEIGSPVVRPKPFTSWAGL